MVWTPIIFFNLLFMFFPKIFNVICVDVYHGVTRVFINAYSCMRVVLKQRLFFQYFLYYFQQSEYIFVPRFIHFSIRRISVSPDLSSTNTKKSILSSLSQPWKSHRSLATLPLLYFHLAIKELSISIVWPTPPIWYGFINKWWEVMSLK